MLRSRSEYGDALSARFLLARSRRLALRLGLPSREAENIKYKYLLDSL